MTDWLLKTEPSDYSFDDLTREKTTVWTGVANPVAKKHLAEMKPGERVIVYHTGSVKAAVGLATVLSAEAGEVTIAAGAPLKRPVPLAEIKESPLFAGSPLVTIGRLSVVPLTAAQLRFLAGR